jgi:2-dehydro-3-deoxyphosphogluconate aldolase / (4S)-4-hydroxy-2-oxoglutarate aldolase
MQMKFDKLSTIYNTGVILIVRVNDPDVAYDTARAAVDGGIKALEVTLSLPGAMRIIEKLATELDGDVLVGAGTVLDGYAAYSAISAGAGMLVSPQLNSEMLKVARRYQVVSVSGALTPTEITETICEGADMVKLFPSETNGPAYVKSILAPLAPMPIVPTGGVNVNNIPAYFDAGAVAVSVGSYVTHHGTEGAFSEVTAAAARVVSTVQAYRQN